MDSVRASQAAVEKKLQELEQERHKLQQDLQQLPDGAERTAVQQQLAAVQQRMAALEQERVELVRQAGLEGLPKWQQLLPFFLVTSLVLGLGVWQLRWQGWRIPPGQVGWTIAGGWGAISAIKDSLKLEPPYRFVLTWPRWVLRKLKWNNAVVWSVFGIAYLGVVALVVLATVRVVPQGS